MINFSWQSSIANTIISLSLDGKIEVSKGGNLPRHKDCIARVETDPGDLSKDIQEAAPSCCL